MRIITKHEQKKVMDALVSLRNIAVALNDGLNGEPEKAILWADTYDLIADNVLDIALVIGGTEGMRKATPGYATEG